MPKINFLRTLSQSEGSFSNLLFKWLGGAKLEALEAKYNLPPTHTYNNVKGVIWSYFSASLSIV